MSRSDQWYGLTDAAETWLSQRMQDVSPLDGRGKMVEGAWGDYAGQLGIYLLDNGDIVNEELQEVPWSSGPCYLTALQDVNGQWIKESLWTEFEDNPIGSLINQKSENDFDLDDYQNFCHNLAMTPGFVRTEIEYIDFVSKSLVTEAAEIVRKVYEAERDNSPLDALDLVRELGDVMWGVACISKELNTTLEDVMTLNMTKLKDRQERGTLSGSGDYR